MGFFDFLSDMGIEVKVSSRLNELLKVKTIEELNANEKGFYQYVDKLDLKNNRKIDIKDEAKTLFKRRRIELAVES